MSPMDSNALTPQHWQTSKKLYSSAHCADTGCLLDDLTTVMTNRDGWWKRIKGIPVVGTSWWWWWWWFMLRIKKTKAKWLQERTEKSSYVDNSSGQKRSCVVSPFWERMNSLTL